MNTNTQNQKMMIQVMSYLMIHIMHQVITQATIWKMNPTNSAYYEIQIS